jgi:alpha-galactosidase
VPLSDGSVAAAMLNRGNSSATITASWSMLGLSPASSLRVLDMWAAWDGRPTRVAQGPFGLTAMQVPSHGVEYVRVTPAAKRGRLGAFRA